MATKKGFMHGFYLELVRSTIVAKSIERLSKGDYTYNRLMEIAGEWQVEIFWNDDWETTYIKARSLEDATHEMSFAIDDFPDDRWRVRNILTGEIIPGEVLQKA